MKKLIFFLLFLFAGLSFGCGDTCTVQTSQNCLYAITYNTAGQPGQLTLYAYPNMDATISVSNCASIVSSTVIPDTCENNF